MASADYGTRSPADRFQVERRRLGLSHAQVAALGGTARNTVWRWEKGAKLPAEKLAILALHGFDVQWVLTGVRSPNADLVASKRTAAYGEPSLLEQEIIERVEDLNTEQQQRLLEMLKVMFDEG